MEEECSSVVASRFGWVDYVVFGAVLVISMGIGVFHGCFGGRQKTTAEFLMGNRQINFWTLGASLAVGFTSAISLLGNTAEMYNFGTQYALGLVAFVVMVPVTFYLYLPTFRDLGITSIYEYFNRRFNNNIRLLMAVLFIIQTLLYLSVVVYAPALALRQVTGLDVLIAVAIIFVVCITYSAIGGIKAVVWTDTFQFVVIMAALITVLVLGLIYDGSPSQVWQDALDTDRIEFFNINPDPRIRHSFWTVVVGSSFYWIAINAATQPAVQRLMSAGSLRHAMYAMWLSCLGMFLIYSLTFYLGLVMYTHFKNCDPLLSKAVEATDQMFPYYVMELAGDFPGLPGLFVAGVFSAALSTVASGLNGLAASTLKDILFGGFNYKPEDSKGAIISKGLSALYGVLGFALVFLIMQLGGVLQVAISFNGMLAGAALGTFTLGMYFPWANSWGAFVGTLVGCGTTLWMSIGSQVASAAGKLVLERKLVGTDCPNCTITLPEIPDPDEVFDAYRISYLYYAPISCFLAIIFGIIVSGITGWQKLETLDPTLISPLIRSKVFKKKKVIELETMPSSETDKRIEEPDSECNVK